VNPRYREDDRIRAAGICTAWAERDPDLCGVAAPVFGVAGRLIGVLSVSAPILRRDKAGLVTMKPIVLESAAELERN
jgi:DNA-binding IclR family transcriptional regulator